MRALITGITGQDGSYLAELLLDKGYDVYGVIRRSSSFNTGRIDHIFDRLHLLYGDLGDSTSLERVLGESMPDEIYNLGAQSHVRTSFDVPLYTCDVDGLGNLRLLEAMVRICPRAKFYQASSSELFGKVVETPQRETTPFYPRSPYGIAKQFAYWTTVNYRESHKLFACNGILFNHESPRRGETFVSRKITERRGQHPRREADGALPRQPRRAARLGLRQGVCGVHVADAPAAVPGRLRHRHGGDTHRPRLP